MNTDKLIKILDPQAQTVSETVFEARPAAHTPLFEVPGGRRMSLMEAATTVSEFPQLIRDGLRTILFSSYAGAVNTHERWVKMERSNKPEETWIEGSTLGLLPIVPENSSYPEAELGLDRSVKITNQKRGAQVAITWEMMNYDQTGLIRQQVEDLGRAMAMTEESDAYTVLTTAGNYIRNSTTGDNDVGPNTAATTFSAAGLVTALGVLRRMKDRKTGRYLGVGARGLMLVVTPQLEFAAKQLLMSPEINGLAKDATYGTGTTNPFRGIVNEILVSPWVGTTHEWVLMEPGMAVVKQVVRDLDLLSMTENSLPYFERDANKYRASKIYGIGMLNDRFAYYSSATAGPVVA